MGVSVAVVLLLVTRISVCATDCCATCGTDCCAFKRAAGLVANHAAEKGTAECAGSSPTLSVGPGRSGTIGKGDCRSNASEGVK